MGLICREQLRIRSSEMKVCYQNSPTEKSYFIWAASSKEECGEPDSGLETSLNSHPSARENWVLAIAGWDQVGYEGELKNMTSDYGLMSGVRFLGPLFGQEKDATYHACDAFILPSLSEGLPMTVLEAWAYAKPVLMTPECNLPEGFAAGAAVQIGTTP